MREDFDFECRKCGNCCRPSGYVRLSDGEPDAMAEHMGISPHEFIARYTRLTDNRKWLSLSEKADGVCVLLSEDGRCLIQEVKPQQCRDFPLKWNYEGYERTCMAMRNNRGG